MKKTLIIGLCLVLVVGAFAACSLIPQSKQLVASWMDSTNTCGYEFRSDGTCTITFANFTIPIVNMNYDGTVDGVYTTTKTEDGNNHITITYTIFTKSISQEYIYSVNKSALTLTAIDDGDVTTFIKQTASSKTTVATTAAAQ